MKLLVNASNLVIGGGIQVGVWFIRECLARNLDAHFAISPQIQHELELLGINTEQKPFHKFSQSPARDKATRKALQTLANSLNVERVFTLFGPAYVDFTQPHLCGFADGWVSHSRWQNFKRAMSANFKQGLTLLLTCFYKAIAIRQADAWVFETDVAANGLSKRARLPKSRCHVVANNCAQAFFDAPVKLAPKEDTFTILYLSADYPHKGIDNFLGYAKALNEKAPEQAIKFVISIAPGSPTARRILDAAQSVGIAHYFDFCGHVPIAQVVEKIDASHLVMQMSHLETFSANYPEAMARQRPLLVSDYPFARDICDNAARYVDPDNADVVADAIIELKNNPALRRSLTENGTKVLSSLPTLTQRFDQYLEIITTMNTGK